MFAAEIHTADPCSCSQIVLMTFGGEINELAFILKKKKKKCCLFVLLRHISPLFPRGLLWICTHRDRTISPYHAYIFQNS